MHNCKQPSAALSNNTTSVPCLIITVLNGPFQMICNAVFKQGVGLVLSSQDTHTEQCHESKSLVIPLCLLTHSLYETSVKNQGHAEQPNLFNTYRPFFSFPFLCSSSLSLTGTFRGLSLKSDKLLLS